MYVSMMNTLEETRRFIRCVRDHPALWNSDTPEYKLVEIKEAVWQEVAMKCGFPDVNEAKTMWRKLRDGHRQSMRRSSLNKSLRGQWKHEKEMEFLVPVMKLGSKSKHIYKTSEIQTTKYELNEDNQDAQKYEDRSESEQDPSEFIQYNSYVPPKKIRRIKSALTKAPRCQIDEATDTPVFATETRTFATETPDKALENFFMSMLLATSQLPERLQVRVQRKIFNTVMEAKEENLSQPTSNIVTTRAFKLADPIRSTKRGKESPQSVPSDSEQSISDPMGSPSS